MFNLVMFIANARARGIGEAEIVKQLKEKSWSREQIVYALKKQEGKRTGMFEIIPIERLFAFFRNRRAEKDFATGSVRQIPQKINKPGFRGINKW